MSDCSKIDSILKRGGTGQSQREIAARDPHYFALNDFQVEDWILFAFNFAQHLNYYESKDDLVSVGTWEDFFNPAGLSTIEIPFRTSPEYSEAREAISSYLESHFGTNKVPAHLALFVCFIHLLEHSKSRFNNLGKKHLDFYYKEILQVDNLDSRSDQVHVVFELAKKSLATFVGEGTELDGGKDQGEKPLPLVYTTDNDLVVNQAGIADVRNVYNDSVEEKLKASFKANSLDGMEEALPEDSPYWLPFGYGSAPSGYLELPDAKLGFALAAPILALAEGHRTVAITIDFEAQSLAVGKPNLEDFSAEDLKSVIQVLCSGQEDWIGPLSLLTTNIDDTTLVSSVSQNSICLVFQLDKSLPAWVPYNDQLYQEGYDLAVPLVKVLWDLTEKPGGAVGYRLYRALANRVIANLEVNTHVKDAKSVLLKNDNGQLPSDKPFYPFTTRPLKNSSFYLDYPELFSKVWTDFQVRLNWNNTPADFGDWYKAYISSSQLNTSSASYIEYLKTADSSTESKIVSGNNYFKATSHVLHEEEWDLGQSNLQLFSGGSEFYCDVVIHAESYYAPGHCGPLRLTLNQTFLHELFPRFYALAMGAASAGTLIPNEPYSPLVGSVSLDYNASESRSFSPQSLPITEINPVHSKNTKEAFENERIRLFHLHPFGQCEEHNYLKYKARANGVTDRFEADTVNSYLLPTFCTGGQLYIGLENAEPLQTVSLLIQVLEGSENPLTPSFEEGEGIHWSVLCNNRWKSLKEDILQDNTDHFLTSGIVKFNIPKQATDKNTRLPYGHIWIKAQMHKSFDAVCKVIGLHTQAVEATFENRENELSHLVDGLPAGSIAKMSPRIPQIKSVLQPYNSFLGMPEESDTNFYRRISERIRHKNRAVTLWDYEHLVLQEFPEIYKVKCLNHTKDTNFLIAGEVTLIVIPDMVNKNVFDVYQPRVSTAMLHRIADFVNERNTMHVSAGVCNPDYEEVKIDLEVQFNAGLDKSYHLKKLDEDLKKLLSPWAFNDTEDISFSVSLHRSLVINYLEKLNYVDYLQNVRIFKDGVIQSAVINPTSPRAILVSAKSHNINPITRNCKGVITEVEEPCQV